MIKLIACSAAICPCMPVLQVLQPACLMGGVQKCKVMDTKIKLLNGTFCLCGLAKNPFGYRLGCFCYHNVWGYPGVTRHLS